MRRATKGIDDLQTINPKVAEEWHPIKNGQLYPDMIKSNSHEQVWWLGKCGHEWKAVVRDRNRGSGCVYCTNQKVLKGFNDLESQNPALAREWHLVKNEELKATEVTSCSGKKVWWLGMCGHEWQDTVAHRKYGRGCPICSNKQILIGYNDLATIRPDIAEEWHPTKNGEDKAEMYSAFSHKKVWWKCKKGHEWKTNISGRRAKGCPICSNKQILIGYNDLATVRPDIAEEWHPTRNGELTPRMFTIGAEKKVWWCCKYGHEWQAYIFNRTRDNKCPICTKELQTSFPEQAIYFYIMKNFSNAMNGRKDIIGMELDIYIPSVNVAIEYDSKMHNSKKSYQLEDKKNVLCMQNGIKLIRIREKELLPHENCICIIRRNKSDEALEEIIREVMGILGENADINIQRDRNLIYNMYINSEKENSLFSINSVLAEQWHPSKNGNITTKMVTANSGKKAWWLGRCGHEWQAVIGSRNKGNGCPYCANQKVLEGFNDLASKNFELSLEWHPTKNEELRPNNVIFTSNRKIWWRCKMGHEWQDVVRNRYFGKKCPYCK